MPKKKAGAPKSETGADRRADLRLAGGGAIDAVILDEDGVPVKALGQPRVINVSAGGMAVATDSSVKPGSVLSVTVVSASGPAADRQFKLRTLDCTNWEEKSRKIRCKLVAGRVPAQLIYNW